MATEIIIRESAADMARRLWDGDTHSTARRLLKELLSSPDQEGAIEVLLPWITERVQNVIRSEVRKAEEGTFASPAGRPGRTAQAIRSQTGKLPALDNIELLLTLPVLVPVAGRTAQSVAWGAMTAADHKARIGSLRSQQDSLQVTIKRHEWAIDEIAKHKVTCLNEIDVATLKADLSSQPMS